MGLFGSGNGNTPGSGEDKKDKPSLLQTGLGLAGAGAVAYGTFKDLFGKKPSDPYAESIKARRKEALMGRLGPSPEEIEQRKDFARRGGLALASQGGEAAERAVLSQTGGSGVPTNLSETSANIQAQYIQAGGEAAAQEAANIDRVAAQERQVQFAQLQEDEKYLASLRANEEDTLSSLLVGGGKVLFGLSGLGGPLDALAGGGGYTEGEGTS